MLNVLAIFVGGGIGAVLRYLTGVLFCGVKIQLLPVATLTVNVLACLIIGICFSVFEAKTNLSPTLRLALTSGFCGGFSTLSALALESVLIYDVNPSFAIVYTVGSVIICVFAVVLGIWLGKFF